MMQEYYPDIECIIHTDYLTRGSMGVIGLPLVLDETLTKTQFNKVLTDFENILDKTKVVI